MPAAIQRALHWARQRFWPLVMPGVMLGVLPSILAAAILIVVLAESRAQPLAGEEALVNAAQISLGQALRAGDKSAARKLLSLQFTFADENGKIFPRKEFLADLKTIAAGEAATDVKVSVYGLVAMVTGNRKSAQGSLVFFLDIWAKQKGSWRALTMQDVMLGGGDSRAAAAGTPPGTEAKADAKPYECKNPCEAIPYRVRSPAEQDVITAFQAIEKAAVAHNADEWGKHIADDFVLYRSGYAPVPKSGNIATIEREKTTNASVTVSEIETMRLSVYGDGAAMIASHVSPDNSRPPFRAASIWAKRNGQWQLVIDVETDVKG
jgi:Domain of unknown function (DUF4440)